MKIKKLLLLPTLLLMTSCKDSHIYVSSIITNKWDRTWVQVISTGSSVISIPHHDYYFQFNEWKPYTKKITEGDYDMFEVGDTYTFTISEEEKSYFFDDSIVVVEE